MSNNFLCKWINQEEEAQVALVSAPVTVPPLPSAALSIFKSTLEDAGISAKVIYAMFPMIHMISKEAIYKISRYMPFLENAEYMFASFTDVSDSVPVDQFIRTFTSPDLSDETIAELTELFSQTMKKAEELVEAVAERIIHMGAKIVAASSVHRQQIASLAILKKVKELDPSVYTILGGHNVSGEMGMAILRNFPSVDYISFGEGDETIAEVCSNLLTNSNRPMPYGVIGHSEPYPETAPFRMTGNMNEAALPDYRDFFDEIQMVKEGFYGDIPSRSATAFGKTVFLEGSRGCRWGAKHPCSFCSINGLNDVYREKTPEKLYSEIRKIAKQYPGYVIHLTDNMLSRHMIRELHQLTAGKRESYPLYAETRTNLKPGEVQALFETGFHQIQPGIESLNDHLLKLLNKGSSAIQNIAFLKYCRTFHVSPFWNMMTQIPGEKREDYEQMLELMPLIYHLYPPLKVIIVGIMRFSGYGDDPEEYGLELQPDLLYQCCFKDRPDIVNNIGVFYEISGGSFADTIRENSDIYRQMKKAVTEWRKQFFSDKPPKLFMEETGSGILIQDTRACREKESWLLTGADEEIYRLAWEPVTLTSLMKQIPEYSEEMIKNNIDILVDKKLMIFLNGKYLALAVRKDKI